MLGIGSFFILLNLFQSFQFLMGILDDERMTKNYYWSAFLDIKKDAGKDKYLEINHYKTTFSDINRNDYTTKELYSNNFENKAAFTDNGTVLDTIGYQSKGSLLIKSNVEFPLTYKSPYNLITSKDHLFIKVSFNIYPLDSVGFNSCIVCTMQNYTGKNYGYRPFTFDTIHPSYKKWTKVEFEFLTPVILHDNDNLEVYYWNFEQKNAIIDNFKIMAYEPK